MSEIVRNIEQDMSGMVFRMPIVDGEMSKDEQPAIKRIWKIVTEVARRVIVDNSEETSQAADFVTNEPSDQLLNSFVRDVPSIALCVKKAVNTAGKLIDHGKSLATSIIAHIRTIEVGT